MTTAKPGLLDNLLPFARHAVLLVLVPALVAGGQVLVDQFDDKAFDWSAVWKALAGGALVALLAWVTPLTRQYGIGATPPVPAPPDTIGDTP